MTTKESVEQLNSLIEHFNNGGNDFNATDIEAIQCLLKENQELKKQIEALEKLNKQLINKLDRYDAIVDERDELKKQLEVGEEQYNDLVEEKEKLQEQLSGNTLQLEEYKHKGLYNTCLPYSTGYKKAIKEKENQQKEFIEYLEDLIKQNETVVEVSKYGLPKNCSKLLIDFYKEILSKFKKIIGSDINVGSIGDKDE